MSITLKHIFKGFKYNVYTWNKIIENYFDTKKISTDKKSFHWNTIVSDLIKKFGVVNR